MNVNHKLPCQILSFSQVYEDDDDLMKVKIRVCHDGENPNGSDFSLESLAKAQPTLSNRPILAYSVFDEESRKKPEVDSTASTTYSESTFSL